MAQTLRFDADGLDVTALQWGEANAPLALLIHGYPDTAWTWRHVGPMLAARGFRAVAPFSRGYAPTALAPDGGYEVGALVRDVVACHRALGGDARAVLVGHDWGAATAYVTAAFAPGLFARVVTMSVPPVSVLLGLAGAPALAARQARRSWYMGYQQLPGTEHTLTRVIPGLWRAWSPGYDGREDAARALAALDTPARRTAALRYYRALAQPWMRRGAYAQQRRYERTLGTTPTLYLHGAEDGCMLADVARRASRMVDVEILPGVGHFPQLEDPERVGARIADFVSG